ncbi:hypothetical protein Prudu_008918, partial [Prunus dulcis]
MVILSLNSFIYYELHMQATTVQLPTAFFEYFERESEKEMATVFARGAQTMNTMVFKPIGRKHFHKNSSSADVIRETKKFEVMKLSTRTIWEKMIAIYGSPMRGLNLLSKGQEKVMDEISPRAVKDMGVNWDKMSWSVLELHCGLGCFGIMVK